MPEAPQMQALAERIEAWLQGATFEGYEPLGFTGLKTFDPPPEALVGQTLGACRPAGEVRVAVVRQRAAGDVPPVAGGPARLRGSSEVHEAEGLSRAVAVLGRPGRADPGVRYRTQGGLVGARTGRRRPARQARAGSVERRVRRVRAHVNRWSPHPHDLARPTHRRRRRARLRRRRVAPGEVVAVCVAQIAVGRGPRTPDRRAPRSAGRRSRARAQARTAGCRPTSSASTSRCTASTAFRAQCAAPTSNASPTSRTRSCTARRVRRPARSLPTAARRAFSSNAPDEPRGPRTARPRRSQTSGARWDSHTVTSAPAGPAVRARGPASVSRTASPFTRVPAPSRSAVPRATNTCTIRARRAPSPWHRAPPGRPRASRRVGGCGSRRRAHGPKPAGRVPPS